MVSSFLDIGSIHFLGENIQNPEKLQLFLIYVRLALFVATVATDSAVFVAQDP